MPNTHTHHSSPAQERAYSRHEERVSYGAVWTIVAFAVMIAVAFGYFTSEPAMDDNQQIMQMQQGAAISPAGDGAGSTMTGSANDNALTPSVTTPGSPDTTTTESSSLPVDDSQ